MKNKLSMDYFYHMAYSNNSPVSVMIELLTECNLRCKHCYLSNYTNTGMTIVKMKNLLTELRNLGVVNISFTGGEIFLRDDIFELIETARNLHMRVFLLTNATILNRDMVKRLAELHVSEISTTVFSLNPDIHDFITGTSGSLEAVLANLKLLKEYGVRVKVKTPIMNINALCYKDIKKYCDENNFEYFVSPTIFSKIDGDESPKDLRVEQEVLRKILKDLDKINDNGKKSLYKYDVPCSALFYSFAIDCNGDVFPCNSLPLRVGNVYNESLYDIWYESEILKFVKSIKKLDLENCKDCKYKTYCYRCPGMAYFEDKSLYACDTYAKSMAEIRACNICSNSCTV